MKNWMSADGRDPAFSIAALPYAERVIKNHAALSPGVGSGQTVIKNSNSRLSDSWLAKNIWIVDAFHGSYYFPRTDDSRRVRIL